MAGSDWAQDTSKPFRQGVPQDWSQQHLIFSRDSLQQHPELALSEARILHQALQRWRAPVAGSGPAEDATATAPHRDWSVSLGRGRLAPNMFPAKYSFDVGAPPSCANDFVVFGLNIAGATGGQANLVAFNNLYAGTSPAGLCGTAPTVLFAYNITTVTAGRILDSPTLSLDGKKIAFVESGSTRAIFHVLTWTGGQGSITAAAAPTAMTSLTFAPALDTRSSPWIDYNTDTAYVGADNGLLYKITGVFKGTPTLAGAPWPITLSTNRRLTAPVLDKNLGLVIVGSQNGSLFSVNATTGAVKSLIVGANGGTNPGILAPPVVDITNGTTFVVSSNNGTSGVLEEADTATLTALATANIGIASKSGTAVNLYQPAFSNDYFNNPSTGVARLCGTGVADTTPWQYAFGFTGRVMNTTPAFSAQLVNSTTSRCTGWTEFFNPNVGVGGTDFFFFGLSANCTGPTTSGCAVARNANGSLTMANVAGGPSGVVVDNYSTSPQASSIYFTGAQTPNLAYKMTQNGLQ